MSASTRPALVILAHGSPDPRWRAPVDALCAQVRAHTPTLHVTPAFLAHDTPTLDDAVATLDARGYGPVEVACHFMSSGGNHVAHQIPARIAALARRFPAARITLRPGALGEDPRVLAALARAAADLQ